MKAKELTLLRVLLNRYHKGSIDSAAQLLPEDERDLLLQESSSATDVGSLVNEDEILSRIHYSWLKQAFQKIPEPLHGSVLAALSSQQAVSLSPLVGFEGKIPQLTSFLRPYFLRLLYKELDHEEILPLAYLKKSSLFHLAELNKRQLVELISFLSLYDLAEEMQHIIDKNRLDLIYNALSSKRQQFLRLCMHQKQKVILTRIGVDHYAGKGKELEKMLHKRGIIRLATALCGEDKHFVWFLSRLLDSGRGEILLRHFSEKSVEGVTPSILKQVKNVIRFLNLGESRE